MVRLFNLYIPLVMLMLAAIDAAVLPLSWQIAGLVPGLHDPTYEGTFGTLPGDLLILSCLSLLFIYAMGLYRGILQCGARRLMLRLLTAFALSAAALLVLMSPWPDRAPDPLRLAASMGMAMAVILMIRLALHPLEETRRLRQRVLVLGTGARGRDLERMLSDGKLDRLECAGFLPVLGGPTLVSAGAVIRANDIPSLCRRLGVQEVVVALDDMGPDACAEVLRDCRRQGLRVVDYSTFLERELGQVPVDDPNAPWLLYSDGTSTHHLNAGLKRFVDVVLSASLLLATLPVTALTALLIRLEDGGPVFYAQERVGLHGRTFKVLKFRSMRVDAEADGKARWAAVGDSRVTRIGRFIRLVRIDEIPQVLNVLRNEMSFIGPRPERPGIVDDLVRDIPAFALRHMVKPGITGWAQVNYPYGASKEDSLEKLKFDLFYIKNGGIVLDLLIVLQTLRVVLWADGSR